MSADALNSWFRKFHEFGDVSVVHVDLTPHERREAHTISWLDESEWDRWLRYRFDRPRREFALCRAVLRSILCSRLGCENEPQALAINITLICAAVAISAKCNKVLVP